MNEFDFDVVTGPSTKAVSGADDGLAEGEKRSGNIGPKLRGSEPGVAGPAADVARAA